MALKLMYITNKPDIAIIAEQAGVDRIFIDMEYIGKADRQGGMNTVQNHHTVEDVKKIKKVLKKAKLLVRVNPIHEVTNDYISSTQVQILLCCLILRHFTKYKNLLIISRGVRKSHCFWKLQKQ